MSSSGINAINSGPLIIRSYFGNSINNTYALGNNDIPISSNRILITSTNGLVVPSDNIYISSITASTINTSTINTSTLNATIIYTSTLIASTIDTNTLNASTINTSTINTSTLIISTLNASIINTSTLNASTINTSTLNAISMNTSTLVTSTINGLPYPPQDDAFWSGSLMGNITNDNTGNVRITTNLDCDSIINISSIFAPNTLNISSNQTYVKANKFKYFSADPSTIDTFKIDLSGSNLLTYKTTISTIDATVIQNNGGGQLVLATDEPIIYINGSANGNNHIGIGISNPQAALHITDPTVSQVFTTSGTFVVPQGVNTINFEIIGAGGPDIFSIGISGTGGYIKGTINVSAFIGQIITIGVGNSNAGPPGASYITIPSTGPLFVMAGAGGAGSKIGIFPPYQYQNGGCGGGGTFSLVSPNNYVAIGCDGQTLGSGVGGQGGQTSGGGTGGSCSGTQCNPGNGRPNPETYLQALGGVGNVTFPGGSGYTGGGEGCGAGGGSSYYNSSYTTIISSYSGNTLPAGILPGYGRNAQNGYVKISYLGGEPSLVTSGAVGIGTTNPQALLDIKGSLSTLSIIDNSGSSGISGQVVTAGTGGQVIWSTITGGGDVFWSSTLNNGGIVNNNTGGVGIGTSNPQALLDI